MILGRDVFLRSWLWNPRYSIIAISQWDISYKLIKLLFSASLHLFLNSKDHKIMNQCLKYLIPALANKINVFILFMGTCPQFNIKKLYDIFLSKKTLEELSFFVSKIDKETINTDSSTTQKRSTLCFHITFIIPLSKLSPSIKIQCKNEWCEGVINKAALNTVT